MLITKNVEKIQIVEKLTKQMKYLNNFKTFEGLIKSVPYDKF
jgi:hypothetical protein